MQTWLLERVEIALSLFSPGKAQSGLGFSAPSLVMAPPECFLFLSGSEADIGDVCRVSVGVKM